MGRTYGSGTALMNEALEPILGLIRRDPGIALIAVFGAYLVLLGLVLWSLARYSRLAKRQARLLRGADGSSLEKMLLDYVDAATDIRGRIDDTADSNASNAAQIRNCLQKIGVIRYDAFPDVGGEQSFSLALLDADDNGLVLSSLFSRNHMRVYAKPIQQGISVQSLTDEEKEAISASRIELHSRSNATGASGRRDARTVAR